MAKRYSCQWEPSHVCNFRCHYCNIPFDSPEQTRSHKGVAPADWLAFWTRLHEIYGSFYINVLGGEPSVYPTFIDLYERVSRHHSVNVTTNLSWEPEQAVGRWSPERISVSASFHPQFMLFEKFLRRVMVLKEAGFFLTAHVVGYPPVFGDLPEYERRFEEVGVKGVFGPYNGTYAGRTYPDSYSPEQRAWLSERTIVREEFYRYRLALENPKGRLCETGVRYFKVYPDGNVFRCSMVSGQGDKPMGNIKDRDFALMDEAAPCAVDKCLCWLETRYLKDVPEGGFFKAKG